MNVGTPTTTQKKERNSNLEILRVICMILIVAHHFVGGTEGFIEFPPNATFNLVAYHMIGLWGQAAVLCLVMITGYFMVTGTVKVSKIIRLAIETWFYSILITVVMIYAGILQYNSEVGLRTFFPLLMREYWFVTDYIILLLLTPALNRFLHSATKKELKYLVTVLLVVGYYMSGMKEYDYISTPFVFIVFYILAAYIRMCPNNLTENKRISPIIFIVCIIFGFSVMYLMDNMYQGSTSPLKSMDNDPEILIFFALSTIILTALILAPIKKKKECVAVTLSLILFASILVYMPYRGLGIRGLIEERYCILMGLTAVSLFLTFKNMKPRHSKMINWLAEGTLSVYLIHYHSFLYEYYWKKLFSPDMLMQNLFPLKALAIIVGLVLLLLIVDHIRETLFRSFAKLNSISKLSRKLDFEFSKLFLDPENTKNCDQNST